MKSLRSSTGWWGLLVVLAVFAALRWRVLDAPLERDEGEYALAGQWILRGVPPYAEVYNMKWPGIYLAYAGIMALFGQTAGGIHLGLLVVNATTSVFVFLLTQRLAGRGAALTASFAFGLLSISQSIHGVFANAEHFVLLPATAGLWLCVRAVDSGRLANLIGAGLCLGSAALVKQHGAAFAVAAGLFTLIELGSRKELGRALRWSLWLVLATLAPLVVTALCMWAQGVFDNFWLWTVRYARAYVGELPFSRAWASFRHNSAPVFGAAPLLWALGAAGPLLLLLRSSLRPRWSFVWPFFLLSLLAITPGYFFRRHYFLLLLPVISVGVGLSFEGLRSWVSKSWAGAALALLIVLCAADGVWRQRDFLFRLSPADVTRFTFPYNPFAESVEVADYLAANSDLDDRVAVLGSEPQICFYADRRPATGFIYMYPLMTQHAFTRQMQLDMMREVEQNAPEFLVYVSVPGSWLNSPAQYPEFARWIQELQVGYQRVQRVAVRTEGLPNEEQISRLPPGMQPAIEIFRKNP